MQSTPDYRFRIHPALTSFADECCATLARLIAYVGALALFAIVSLNFWDQLQLDTAAAEPADQPGFTLASRSRPAFAVSSLDLPEKSDGYEIFRHPAGGRKDIFHWGPPGEKRWPSSKSTAPAASSTHPDRRPPISPRAWRKKTRKEAHWG